MNKDSKMQTSEQGAASFVIQVSGKQQRASIGSKLICDRLKAEEGQIIELPVLAFLSPDGLKTRGVAKAKVLEHYKGEKRVFFRKSQRGGDRNRGRSSRPYYTTVVIEEVRKGE